MKSGVFTLLSGASLVLAQSLPIVDLGYNIQQATSYNSTGKYYDFSNIRYAAPPVGDLRFAHPHKPAQNRSVVQTGQNSVQCPQALPNWIFEAESFVPQYLAGKRNFNLSSFSQPGLSVPAVSPGTDEDCLFLDVFVPEGIWNNRNSSKKAPVLFWIYGGGFTEGSKSASGNPSGLLYRAQNNSQPGVIYVAPNYRLGAFGWLGGPSFQSEGGVANLGLYDQRRALEWVQKHIHLFGGDKDQVTVFGESAGGSSILHQITAFGGTRGPSKFKRAVLQSAAYQVQPSLNQLEVTYQNFLAAANVSTLAELRALNSSALLAANALTVEPAPYGTFTYGPVVDGVITPSIVGQLLSRGQFDHNLTIMVGHNTDEGILFANPAAQNATEAQFAETLYQSIPTLRGLPNETAYILQTLYPPIYNGSQPYDNPIARAALITAEFGGFNCNEFYLDKAFGNKTHSYLFNVFPAIHGADIAFTYNTGNNQQAPPVAIQLQDYITQFAEFGSPNGKDGVPYFPMYGANATVLELNSTTTGLVRDPAANYRCNYWQSGVWS